MCASSPRPTRTCAILIQQGLFREDLFFRLNVVPLRLPPLRERTEDIPDLVRHFLAHGRAAKACRAKQLEPAALERLKRYRWPGNVRELENLVRRLAALYPQDDRSPATVDRRPNWRQPRRRRRRGRRRARGRDDLGRAVERHLGGYFAGFGDGLPPPGLYDRILREIEMPLIAAALAATRGNQIKAAELLGLNRNTLRKKIRDLDIQVYPQRQASRRLVRTPRRHCRNRCMLHIEPALRQWNCRSSATL